MRGRTRLLLAGAGLGAAGLLVAGGWLAWTANAARVELVAAQGELGPLRGEVLTGDPGVAQRISVLQEHAAAANEATHDPVWAVAAAIPWLGSPAQTVRGLTEAVEAVAVQGLPALNAATTDVHPARLLEGGRIDVAGLAAAAEPLGQATTVLQDERDAVGGLGGSWVGPVARARADLHEQLSTLAALTASAHTAAEVAPGMLGVDEPRRYFVAFQNPGESRGTGGLLDAYAIVKAENGGLTVERTGANTDLPALPETIENLDPVFEERYAAVGASELWVNSNISPHFPEVADAWLTMWQAATGELLDGAVALDPTALSEVLAATGPVTAPVVGQVKSDTVQNLVLLEQYQRADLAADNGQRKQLMLQVGVEAMDAVLGGKASPQVLIPRLREAAQANHVLLYSDFTSEQVALTRSDLAGAVDQGNGPFAQAVMVNVAGSKLDTWLQQSLSYRVLECRESGRTVAVTVRLLNTAPTTGLPAYVTIRSDKPVFETVAGQNRLGLQLLVTRGADLDSATLDGYPVPLAPPDGDAPASLPTGGLPNGGLDTGFIEETYTGGRPSFGLTMELIPDTPRVLEVRFTEPPGVSGPPLLPVQTLVEPAAVTADVSACGTAS